MIAADSLTERKNGHTVMRFGKTIAEKREIEINDRMIEGWVTTNGRYLSGIAAALEDARNDYADTRVRVFDGPAPPDMVESVRTLVEACRADGTLPSEAKLMELVGELRKSLQTYDEKPVWKAKEVEWSAYITRVLMILIPGLEEEEAELLGTDVRIGALIELGYFNPPDEGEAAQEAQPTTVPPAESAPSIGVEPEQSSVGSTA